MSCDVFLTNRGTVFGWANYQNVRTGHRLEIMNPTCRIENTKSEVLFATILDLAISNNISGQWLLPKYKYSLNTKEPFVEFVYESDTNTVNKSSKDTHTLDTTNVNKDHHLGAISRNILPGRSEQQVSFGAVRPVYRSEGLSEGLSHSEGLGYTTKSVGYLKKDKLMIQQELNRINRENTSIEKVMLI